jgi:hypothetical protein
MILGGFFFQGRWRDNETAGGESLVICGYDAVNKNMTSDAYWYDGTRLSGVLRVSGNTFTWVGKGLVAGRSYPVRGQIVVAADFMSFTETFEISADGKTWTPFFEYKYIKAKPAAKK